MKQINNDMEVYPATHNDLKYIDHLQKKNAEELSFYPSQVFEREITNSRILLAKVNDEPAGYLYHGAMGVACKIHQACIEYDLRGQLYGSALVRFLISLCNLQNVSNLTLRCGSDIEANKFWNTMGFYCEAVTNGGVRRMRDINCWRRDLQQPLFTTSVEASNKKKDASVWAKRGSLKTSSMLRGKALQNYRDLVISSSKDKK